MKLIPLAMAAASVMVAVPALADAKTDAEIMALARSQWAAEIANKPMAEQMATVADEYTEFNGDYITRLEGKELNSRLYEALSKSGVSTSADMQNARVQTYGDVAILTYNYVGTSRDKDGKVTANNGKSTRVYAKQGGTWKLVHAHFSSANLPDD